RRELAQRRQPLAGDQLALRARQLGVERRHLVGAAALALVELGAVERCGDELRGVGGEADVLRREDTLGALDQRQDAERLAVRDERNGERRVALEERGELAVDALVARAARAGMRPAGVEGERAQRAA